MAALLTSLAKSIKMVGKKENFVVGGKHKKRDLFFMFYSALDILTIVLKLHCQIVKTGYRI